MLLFNYKQNILIKQFRFVKERESVLIWSQPVRNRKRKEERETENERKRNLGRDRNCID